MPMDEFDDLASSDGASDLVHASPSLIVELADSGGMDAADQQRAERLRHKVESLTEAFGSKSAAAEFLGVTRGQPGKWMSGAERPSPDVERLILDFDYVWDRLTAVRSARSATVWLQSANSFLGGARPLDAIRFRGPEPVISALDSAEAGSFA